MAIDEFTCPQETHVLHAHPTGLPDLDKVLSHQPDVVEVAAHLVVHQCELVRHPEHEDSACFSDLVHDVLLHEALSDVHAS